MPRRRSIKNRPQNRKPRPLNRAEGKLKKWDKASDVFMDEEDLFHASKDKVLFDRDDPNSDGGDDDEVFSLKGLEDEDSNEDEEQGNQGLESSEDEDEGNETLSNISTRNSKVRESKKRAMDVESSEDGESTSEEENWGQSKLAYYSSNAAQIESDDEEGNELEEQEAKRLQIKTREDLKEEDFGLDDVPDIQALEEINDLAEPVPSVVPPLPRDQKLLIRHLEKTSPEALALARDWEDTIENLEKARKTIASLESGDADDLTCGMIHIYYQALLTYTTTLAFYLHLRASEKYVQRPELLKAHPIMQRLLTLKNSLITLEDINSLDSEDSDDDDSISSNDIMAGGRFDWNLNEDLDDDELRELLADATLDQDQPRPQQPPKKKRKISSQPATPIFDLVEPEFPTPKRQPSRAVSTELIDAYGEATTLQHADAADKNARKKSLRFHTSRIESTSARRQGARNLGIGGDDDVPYRERRKEKEARLSKQITPNDRGQGGEDLDDREPEHNPDKQNQAYEENEEDIEGYYELVKKKSVDRKDQKKAEYEAARNDGRTLDFHENASGPRSLTRAILANKGLTPHRPKSVRNPRVKKRLRFEKAKKKISSQKAVYKGGLADTGRYDGEKSGISKVVKSIRLG